MYGGSRGDGLRIEVYVRSLQPRGDTAQQRAFDLLDELVAEDVVEDYEVVVWGDRVPPTRDALRTRAGRFILDRVVVFQRWAEENDVSIEHAFEVRTVDSAITGHHYSELVLPQLVVAAVADDRLVDFAPVTVNGTHVSTLEFIDRLAQGDPLVDPTPVELRSLHRDESAKSAGIQQEHTAAVDTLDEAVEALTTDSGPESERRRADQRVTEPTGSGVTDREDADFDQSETDPAGGDPSSTTYPPY